MIVICEISDVCYRNTVYRNTNIKNSIEKGKSQVIDKSNHSVKSLHIL